MKKNILLIGVGGTGSNAVDTFYKKFHELGNQTENKVSALVFDTDAGDLKKITSARTVVMADNASVGTICDRIGKQYLREWFPCDAKDVRAQEMVRGASQWRKKSYLAFLNLMNKPAARQTFTSALEDMVQDPGASCEVYVIASVAGGTGSGSFIPIALYAKRYLRKNLGKDPIVNAMIALPDIYADSQTPENRVKVYSNAYAILRELNAINLVSRNYNAGLSAKKKAPINFRIGHPDEPNVGVLFDAADKRFWTPEAAPFSQVFLLDRIPGLNSVAAHDMVLANSLYTILCTEIGAAFDSEFSNHELVRSQNNGSNSIYAGISTSQVRFPTETILEYLAFKKTLKSCDSEWLTLHTSVENVIREKEREAKAARRRFTMKDEGYAKLVIDAMNQKLSENSDDVSSIVDRSVTVFDAEGKPTDTDLGEEYLKMIEAYIFSRVPNGDEYAKKVKATIAQKNNKKTTQKDFPPLVKAVVNKEIFPFYRECFNTIKEIPVSTADSVITLNKKKIGTIGDKYSIVNHLLMKNGEYVHPVGALIRLCQFRLALAEKLRMPVDEWEELSKRSITQLPDRYMEIQERVNAPGSAYLSFGDGRLATVYDNQTAYTGKKTKILSDIKLLENDAACVISAISSDTNALVSYKVYSAIAADVDLLIAKYRSFFNRFEKELEGLEEQAADAHRKDEGPLDSVINVYSSKAHKDMIAEIIDDGNGPETDSDIRATDNIVGMGVYNAVFAAAVAERSEDESFNSNDSGTYRSLFGSMVSAYRESIAKSEMFNNIASYNAVEAIVASCGENADQKAIDDALAEALPQAAEIAQPSLRLENNIAEMDLIVPARITVFMMSLNTAKYIKKNAEKFKVRLPADQNSESSVLKSCAEQFIRTYSGLTSARVTIVNSIPDQILYCTGEIMDITPLCIAKFNELGEDNVYFKNYREALNRYRKYGTDMWNPHIGNDLYKRGYLPYMNPDMENTCDDKMVKALLYALLNGYISYMDGIGATNGKYNFVCGQSKIIHNKQPINNKNLAQLLNWMRNEDQKIDDWSAAFDRDINEQMLALPNIVSDSGIATLEAALTNSRFMKMLNVLLYKDPTQKGAKDEGGKQGPSAAEFAQRIKNSEEIDRDCDDAERILRVLYNVFLKLITYRTSPETTPERFIQVYHQQLGNFYKALAYSDVVTREGKECENTYRGLVEWLYQAGLFRDVSISSPLDENGQVAINRRYNYREENEIMNNLTKTKRGSLKAGEELVETPVSPAVDNEVLDDSEE